MVKNATFQVLAEDLKISFGFAVKNIITFLLGLIGVLIVTAITFIIGAIIIFVPLFVIVGIGPMIEFFTVIGTAFDLTSPAILGVIILMVIPLLLPIFVAVGALFGMGREIVESAGASAEGVLTWYRRKFFPLASGGIIIFSIALLPIGLIYAIAMTLAGGFLVGPLNGIFAAFTLVWIVVTLGFLSMTFPAIIDGVPVIEAVKQSIRMSWDYFDRVFSVWISFILILILPLAPLAAIPITMGPTITPLLGGALALMGLIFFILVLIALPAFVIALSRMYMILSGIELPAPEDQEPAISLVGGI